MTRLRSAGAVAGGVLIALGVYGGISDAFDGWALLIGLVGFLVIAFSLPSRRGGGPFLPTGGEAGPFGDIGGGDSGGGGS